MTLKYSLEEYLKYIPNKDNYNYIIPEQEMQNMMRVISLCFDYDVIVVMEGQNGLAGLQ